VGRAQHRGRRVSRRRFLGGVGAATAAGWLPGLWTPARAAAARSTLAIAAHPAGTTLERTVELPSGVGYRRLTEGPGWPIVVREDLVAGHAGREERRRPVAAVVHLTDVHVCDTQSPTRVEFTDPVGPPLDAAFRAQETLTTQVSEAMMTQLRLIGRGPVTGRGYDCAVSTGDNIDNQQHNELDWFMTLLDGGDIVPDSGDPTRHEGVQDDDFLFYDTYYWHPDEPPALRPDDDYKTVRGFPTIPGLLDDARTGFNAGGLPVPWFSTYGNHDGLLQGNAPGELPPDVRAFDAIATGPLKVIGPPVGLDATALVNLMIADPVAGALSLVTAPARPVTADPRRRAVSVPEWIQRHLDSPATPGPSGHGYTPEMVESRQVYYTFDVSPEVLGISLDTVNHGGYADGSIGAKQLAWLEQRLVEAHARYFDPGGAEVRTGNADRLVVLFSHHNLYTLENTIPDLFDPADARLGFTALQALLSRFPNVIAWVNGHSHLNRITPVGDPSGRTGGFWEISTAAHIDYPEHARIVEIAANCDGTISIFGTVIDHAGPAQVPYDDRSLLGLASLSRELSANEPQLAVLDKLGRPEDLNVELLVRAPFDVCPAPPAAPAVVVAPNDTLPPTGGSLTPALVAGGAALAGAVALRRRATTTTTTETRLPR
jgi:metallophosphoesterase (TIGR03767 family)